jgi:hypothetical protein
MKFMYRLAIVLAVIGFVAASMPANAICALPSTFNGAYSALSSPLGAPDVARVRGDFWALGNGSGTLRATNGTVPLSYWVRIYPDPAPGVYYVAGDWGGDPLIQGCIQDPPTVQPAKMVYTIQEADANNAYFTVQCITENALANFDYSPNGAVNPLVDIPKPTITNSVKAGNTVTITATATPPAGGVFAGDCAATLVTGVKFYYKIVPRDTAAPATRDKSQWIALPGDNTIDCGAVDSDAYLATALVFDSGIESQLVSANSTKVQCGPTLATQPDNFRMIKKPRQVGTTR